eukprot:2758195-Pyramimonas_sp.AAC.1
MVLEHASLMAHWGKFLNQVPRATQSLMRHVNVIVSIDRGDRARGPIPVFYRACQGRSCFAHDLERTRAPRELGMA